jgi:hypothetical protein
LLEDHQHFERRFRRTRQILVGLLGRVRVD